MEKENRFDDVKTAVLAVLFVIGVPALIFGVFCASSFAERSKINKDIAALYSLDYSDVFELDSRVNFYSFSAAELGDKNGIFYEVDGEEFEGNNHDINDAIRLYVSSWCD